MVIVPDLITAATKEDGTLDLGLWKAVQTALISHCEQNGNRMAVLDAPPGMTPQQIKDWRSDIAHVRLGLRRAVLPVDQGREPDRRQRRRRGPHPAVGPHRRRLGPHRRDPRRVEGPGQRHHPRRASTSSVRRSRRTSRRVLNPIGINCIRPFGTRGIRIWGARTLAVGHRLALHQRPPAVQHGRVDDPRGHPVGGLRAERRRPVGGRQAHAQRVPARTVDGRRAVRRQSADQAFYVKCDAETNPPESIDQGMLDRRGRHRTGEAGRVRGLPHQPSTSRSPADRPDRCRPTSLPTQGARSMPNEA